MPVYTRQAFTKFIKSFRGSLKIKQKQTGGGAVLECVYVCFLKTNAEIFKMKFYSYSPVFSIDYNDSMKD